MKKRIADLFTKKKVAGSIAALALAVVIGGVALWQQSEVPELPSFKDPVMEEVSIDEEEPPLAGTPKTTTKTTKKTTKKNVTLSKASTKTYTKTIPTTTKTTTKTTKSSTQSVKTQTTVKTAVKEKYTKKSKIKVVTTTVTTTVKTTTTPLTSTAVSASSNLTTASAATSAKKGKYEVSVTALAPKMDARVLNAYQTMGFKVYVDSSVSYGGYFNAKDRSITLREESDNIYHELGHFLAFISGNTDTTSSFKNVYNQEKSAYTGYNKTYVTKDASEYYAESTRDYILSGSALKSSRPNTYSVIESSLNKVTDAQVTKLMKIYAAVWK